MMALFTLTWALFLAFAYVPHVFSLTPSQWCFYGCNSCLYEVGFEGGADGCSNPLFYKSNYYCAAAYCSEEEINAGVHEFNSSCDGVLPTFDSIVHGIDLGAIPRVSFSEPPATFTTPLNHPVIPGGEFWDIGHRTTVSAFACSL